MDYFQGVVTEFLRANRSTFVNTECLIQLEPGDTPEKDRHWFCDVIALNLAEKTIYLCEVSYSGTLAALIKRLRAWAACHRHGLDWRRYATATAGSRRP